MACTWIVVADSSRARFFSVASRAEPLNEVHCMAHVESRSHAHDDFGDQANLSQGGHAQDAHTNQKQHEAAVFARQIAVFLEQGRVRRDFNNLILVAAPHFLGVLRHSLNSHVYDYISNELDKNLVMASEAEIRRQVF